MFRQSMRTILFNCLEASITQISVPFKHINFPYRFVLSLAAWFWLNYIFDVSIPIFDAVSVITQLIYIICLCNCAWPGSSPHDVFLVLNQLKNKNDGWPCSQNSHWLFCCYSQLIHYYFTSRCPLFPLVSL